MAFKIVTFFYEFILITRNDPFIVVELPKKKLVERSWKFSFQCHLFLWPPKRFIEKIIFK